MNERPKVTACLITWKRQKNLPKIIENILANDFIDEIMIRDNSKTENIINYGRYEQAARARNDIIYTQDDDYILKNIGDLYDKFVEDPTRIAHAGPDYYLRDLPNNIHGDTQMSLLGWGAFFDRRWMSVLDLYVAKFGKDYCFYRETDRIFTILKGRRSNFLLGDLYQFPDSQSKEALSEQLDHVEYKKMSIDRANSIYQAQHDAIIIKK